jgi:sphingolipid delta-4 desaturase
MAALLSHLAWRPTAVALALAFAVGAFANHSLYVIIHDAAHDLVFRRRFANKLLALAADLPNLMPGAIAFRTYHLAHHAHLGEEKRDPDLPAVWERRLFGRSRLGKALWVALFPLMQALRSLEVGGDKLRDPWFAANIAANLAFVATIGLTLGWTALIYLFASCWFGLGPHPLGARWIQEHFTLDPAQETMSYYGALNRLALNIGYHNEHHDFPSIPWNRLPDVTGMAPEVYGSLTACRSWAGLLFMFICDRRFSLGSRIARV